MDNVGLETVDRQKKFRSPPISSQSVERNVRPRAASVNEAYQKLKQYIVSAAREAQRVSERRQEDSSRTVKHAAVYVYVSHVASTNHKLNSCFC